MVRAKVRQTRKKMHCVALWSFPQADALTRIDVLLKGTFLNVVHSFPHCSGQEQGLSLRFFFLFSQILNLELKKHIFTGKMEGGLEVICLEIFRHCSGKGERVRAVRDLESTLLYLFLPALNQRENKKKQLLQRFKEKEGRKEREEPKRERQSKPCVPQRISNCPNLANFDLTRVGVNTGRGGVTCQSCPD